jgi:hypothetical protein
MKAAQVPRGGVDLVQLNVVVEAGHDESLTPRSNSKCGSAIQWTSKNPYGKLASSTRRGGYPRRVCVRSWGGKRRDPLGWMGCRAEAVLLFRVGTAARTPGGEGDVTRVTWSKIQDGEESKQSVLCAVAGQEEQSKSKGEGEVV